MKELVLGCIPSVMDGSEKVFGVSDEFSIPDSYSYEDCLPPVLDQGAAQICVPCTLSAYLNWRANLNDGSNRDNGIKMYDIYRSRTNSGEGMSYKDALKYLRKTGVKSKLGVLSIKTYGRVMSVMMLKYALVMNGPCFGALPVFSDDCDFWNKKAGDKLLGYHAIALVGYNENGIVIRNSWGEDFCDNGYTTIPYEEFNKILEIWTVIE